MAKSVKNIREALKKGVVTFQYKKNDGTIRTATGTTNLDTISENYTFKGGQGPERFGYVSYWDMDKQDWRCFNESRLVAVL